MESATLYFRIRNIAQGIQNPANDWNSESKFHWQRLEFSIWNLDSTAWNPESITVLAFPSTWGLGGGGGGGRWVAFDIELRKIEDLNSRRWQINPGISCDISNFFLWLLARYSPEKLFWFLPKAVYLVTLPLIPASPLRNLSNFCLWNPESCALESGIQIKEYGMPLMIWIQNPNSSCKLRNPVRNPESNTVLDSLTWGKAIKWAIPISIALWD